MLLFKILKRKKMKTYLGYLFDIKGHYISTVFVSMRLRQGHYQSRCDDNRIHDKTNEWKMGIHNNICNNND